MLTNPERRKAYDFDLAAAAGMSEDADTVAQNYLAQGIAAYKERKFAEAAGNFQLAVAPQSEGRPGAALPRPRLGPRRATCARRSRRSRPRWRSSRTTARS